MPRIGTFAKVKEQNAEDIKFDGIIAKWEDENGTAVEIIAMKDSFMAEPEYWVTVTRDGKYGGGGPDLDMVYGTKKTAYDEAYDIMRDLAKNPENFQQYMV